jgi:hypothetical protein
MEYVIVRGGHGRALLFWIRDREESVCVSDMALMKELQGHAVIHDLEGRPVVPKDGERFLDAAYLHFLLMGHEVERNYVGRCGLDDPYCLEESVQDSGSCL